MTATMFVNELCARLLSTGSPIYIYYTRTAMENIYSHACLKLVSLETGGGGGEVEVMMEAPTTWALSIIIPISPRICR